MDKKFDLEINLEELKKMDIDEQIVTIYSILKDRNEIKYSPEFDVKTNRLLGFLSEPKIMSLYLDKLEKVDSEGLREYARSLIYKPSTLKRLEYTNVPLLNLVINILNIESGDIIFDLGSGYGNLLALTNDYAKSNGFELKSSIGVEVNDVQASISKIFFSILNASNINIFGQDALYKFNYEYNKGYCFPPFGVRLQNQDLIKPRVFDIPFSHNTSVEWIFIDTLLSGLIKEENSKAVCLCSPGIFFRDADKKYRDFLISKGYIEGIIELPGGSLNYTGMKVLLVILSRNNSSLKLCDASGTVEGKYKFANMELPYQKIYDLYQSSNQYDVNGLMKLKSIIPSNVIIGDDYDFKGVLLSTLVTTPVFAGSQYTSRNFENMFSNEPTGYRILTSSDIQDGYVSWEQLRSIKYSDDKFDRFAVHKNDVVITSKSSRVKTLVVDIEPKEKILVTGGMLIVRPDTSKLNPTYLKIYLDSQQGKIALKQIQNGTLIVSINAKDLGNVLVPDTPIEKQNNIAKQYNLKLSTYLALKSELEKLDKQLENFYDLSEEE